MNEDKVAHRLALIGELELSPADRQSIIAEIEDLDRVVAELEDFGQGSPWISLQAQPVSKKA